MKTILILILAFISSASQAHKLLTDVMKDSTDFVGFGFAVNDIDAPEEHTVYHLSKEEIDGILKKINAQEAIKQFTMHSLQPKGRNQQPINPQQTQEYTEITSEIPHSNQYWEHVYQFECATNAADCVAIDFDSDSQGGHHGGGVFSSTDVGNVRLVAQYVCSHHPVDYGQLLVPYFIGPDSFSHLEFMPVDPYVEVPVISMDHHIEGAYTVDQQIEFKCVYKL